MRPVRAAAHSPGHRPGFFMDANITPCKGKSFLDVFKAFALTGRFFVSVIQVSQVRELIEVKEVITPYGRSGSEETIVFFRKT